MQKSLEKNRQTKSNNIKGSYAAIKWGLFKGYKDGSTSTNQSARYILDKMEAKNHMII